MSHRPVHAIARVERSARRAVGLTMLLIFTAAMVACGPAQPPDAGANDDASASRRDAPLMLFAAAGLKQPVDAVIAEYAREVGVRVQPNYAGSGTLLSQLRVAAVGDLFLAAEASYIDDAAREGLALERFPVASQRPVIVVAAGNPLGISGLADLRRAGVRLVLPDPSAAAIGRVLRLALSSDGTWDALAQRAIAFKPTVHDVVADVRLGAADATLAWDSVAGQFAGVDAVVDERLAAIEEVVTLSVLASSGQPTEALRFARFLSARDRGQRLFADAGLAPTTPADRWERAPQVTLYAGTMFSKVVQEIIRDFERREGVTITTTYNGCGVLVSQMRAGAWPDAYLACDSVFMDDVAERFGPRTTLSENRIVIAVARGNPKSIGTLADLATPGVRVGLGHPQNSALGHLTARIIDLAGLTSQIAASGNVVMDSPSGDMLINALATGSIDATVCYISNVLTSANRAADIEVVPLDGVEGSLATQPFASRIDTDFPMLVERLRLRLLSVETGERFAGAGFTWVAPRLAPADSASDAASGAGGR